MFRSSAVQVRENMYGVTIYFFPCNGPSEPFRSEQVFEYTDFYESHLCLVNVPFDKDPYISGEANGFGVQGNVTAYSIMAAESTFIYIFHSILSALFTSHQLISVLKTR